MKQLTDFLTRLSPMVPGCPQPVAVQALLDTAIEFCERTMLTRYIGEPIPVQPGEPLYDVEVPSEMALVRILHAWYDGRLLELVPAQRVSAHGAFITGQSIGTPTAAHVFETDAIRVFPVPGTQDDKFLTVQVATKPSRTAKTVEDVLFNDWAEVIVGGALARLAVMPGVPFSNLDLAALGSTQFANGISRARLEANKGRVVGDVRVRSRPFSGVRA